MQEIQSRIRISKILALIALILLIGSYTLGPFFEYHDPSYDKEIELNESFQPFSFFIPEGTDFREPPPNLVPLLGEKIYEYHPEGSKAYWIGYHTMPLWKVSLDAPQYPKSIYPNGVPVFFKLTNFGGMVEEMNSLNHYIGMDPMEVGAIFVRKLVPFVYLIFIVMIIGYLFYNGSGWWLLGIVPALIPWYFLGFFTYWLYWFGHNLHEYRAFNIKPFMPTVLGEGKVAQFVTHSYPTSGFYFLLGVFFCLTLSVLMKRKALKDIEQRKI